MLTQRMKGAALKGCSRVQAGTLALAANDCSPPFSSSARPPDDRAGRVPDTLLRALELGLRSEAITPATKPNRSCFVRPGFFSDAVRKMQRSPA